MVIKRRKKDYLTHFWGLYKSLDIQYENFQTCLPPDLNSLFSYGGLYVSKINFFLGCRKFNENGFR